MKTNKTRNTNATRKTNENEREKTKMKKVIKAKQALTNVLSKNARYLIYRYCIAQNSYINQLEINDNALHINIRCNNNKYYVYSNTLLKCIDSTKHERKKNNRIVIEYHSVIDEKTFKTLFNNKKLLNDYKQYC